MFSKCWIYIHSLIEKALVYQAENCLLSRGESINSRPSMRQDPKGTIHLRSWQIFTIFDPYPPPVGSFLLLSELDSEPTSLKNADVLNGWSQRKIQKMLEKHGGTKIKNSCSLFWYFYISEV